MKLTAKQLKTLILEAIKEQAAAPGTGSNPNELNQTLQNVMDYMASLTASRNSLLAALNAIPTSGPPSPATTNAIEVAKRNVLNRGNTAITSLRNFASIAPEAIRSIEFVQNELRTKDFARLTPEQRQTNLQNYRQNVQSAAYRPLYVVRSQMAAGRTTPGTMIASYDAAADAATGAMIAGLAGDSAAPSSAVASAGRTFTPRDDSGFAATMRGFGELRPAGGSPAPRELPPVEERPVRRPAGLPALEESNLRKLIRAEIKKYL